MVHDGDQNQEGGDAGEMCITAQAPPPTTCAQIVGADTATVLLLNSIPVSVDLTPAPARQCPATVLYNSQTYNLLLANQPPQGTAPTPLLRW